jgi:hypothetical protein
MTTVNFSYKLKKVTHLRSAGNYIFSIPDDDDDDDDISEEVKN